MSPDGPRRKEYEDYAPGFDELERAREKIKKQREGSQKGRAETMEIYVTESYLEQREIEAQKEIREVEPFTLKEIETSGLADPTQEERIEAAEGQLERRKERRREKERRAKVGDAFGPPEEKYDDSLAQEKRATTKGGYIPGRRGKPKPGSIADQIDKALRPIFEKQEEAITGVSTGLRTRGKMLMWKSRTLATGKIEDFPEYMGVYMGAMGYRFGAGFVEGVTFVARPLAWGKTVQNIITVAQRPGPALLAAGYEVISDPFGTIAEVGGSLAGGYVAGRAIDYTLGKYQRHRQARFDASVTTEDFLPFEEQYQFPSEVTLGETDFIAIVEKKGMKVGKVEGRLTPMEDYMELKPPKIEDTTSHAKFDTGLDASEKAKWGRLTEGEATLMPRGTWPKKFDIFKKGGTAVITEPGSGIITTWEPIIHLKTVSDYMPGLRIVDISPTVSKPITDTGRTLGALGLTKALTDIKAHQAEVTKVQDVIKLETVITQDVRLVTIQPPITGTISETDIIQDVGIIQIPDVIPDVTPKQKKRQKVKGVQEVVLAPIQEQEIIQETAYAIPMFTFPSKTTPPPLRIPRFPMMRQGGMFGTLKKRGEFRAYPISLPKNLLKMRLK